MARECLVNVISHLSSTVKRRNMNGTHCAEHFSMCYVNIIGTVLEEGALLLFTDEI